MPAPPLPDFTADQRRLINSTLPEFTRYLQAENPTVANYHPGTTTWMVDKARDLMSQECLQVHNLGGRSPSDVEKTIRTYLRNWKNNTYKKKLGSTNASLSSDTSDSKPISPTHRAASEALDNTIRGLVVLEADLRPKDLFFLRAPEAYRAAYASVRDELPSKTPTCVIAQKARKRAWAQADHDEWERRKHGLELDVTGNREVFPDLMRTAIQQNLDRGVIGSALVGLMYSFRTPEGLQHGILYSGFNSEVKGELIHMPQEHDELSRLWAAHSHRFLPSNDGTTSAFVFEHNGEGYPVLPPIDLHDAVLREVANLLTTFFAAIWEKTCPADSEFPALPWIHLATKPQHYFDHNRFKFPGGALGKPIPCSPIHVLAVYDYLLNLQASGSPFRFYPKSRIIDLLSATAQAKTLEVEKDDEVLEDDQSPAAPRVVVSDPSPRSQIASPPSPIAQSTPQTDAVTLDAPRTSPPPPGPATSTQLEARAPDPALPTQKLDAPPSTPGTDPTHSMAKTSPPPPVESTVSSMQSPLETSAAHSLSQRPALPLAPSIQANVAAVTPTEETPTAGATAKSRVPGTRRRKRNAMENIVPSEDTESSGRRSKRVRVQAAIGTQLVAQGQRSPKHRRAGWSYVDSAGVGESQ